MSHSKTSYDNWVSDQLEPDNVNTPDLSAAAVNTISKFVREQREKNEAFWAAQKVKVTVHDDQLKTTVHEIINH